MIPLLLSLLFAGASAVPLQSELIEQFECGPSSGLLVDIAHWAGSKAIKHCHSAVQDRTNLCCKEHDLCFDLHAETKNTREICDSRFCLCLQDVFDRTKEAGCESQLQTFCSVARQGGEGPYERATPDKHVGQFANFEDLKPLGLDMKKLVDTCEYSKVIAVHCHNSVHTCDQVEHVVRHRSTEEEDIHSAHQDCQSNMYFCLRLIVENDLDEKCTSLADSYTEKINKYTKLNETKHGKAIMDAYPLITARLLMYCAESNDAIVRCTKSFDDCAAENQEEHPELFPAIRKIKIVCHQALNSCLQKATEGETTQYCIDARTVAKGLIRSLQLSQDESFWTQTLPNYIKTLWRTAINVVEDTYEKAKVAVKEKAGQVKKTAIEVKNKGVELVEDMGKGLKKAAKATAEFLCFWC